MTKQNPNLRIDGSQLGLDNFQQRRDDVGQQQGNRQPFPHFQSDVVHRQAEHLVVLRRFRVIVELRVRVFDLGRMVHGEYHVERDRRKVEIWHHDVVLRVHDFRVDQVVGDQPRFGQIQRHHPRVFDLGREIIVEKALQDFFRLARAFDETEGGAETGFLQRRFR